MNVNVDINLNTKDAIIKKFKEGELQSNNPYVIFFAKLNKISITIYKENKHKLFPLMIGGKEEALEPILKEFNISNIIINKADKIKKELPKDFRFLKDQIGSDEVGTGDFFGPVTVVASLVKADQISRLKELGVVDSKKLTDERIKQIGKVVIKEFEYSLLTVNNKKYNEVYIKGFNMNKIKAYLHNHALFKLHREHSEITNFYVDEFVKPSLYYKYLEDEKHVLRNIYFHTKGESYFPSVALASVIARYSFLTKMDELNKKYNISIPFGGGDKVNKFAIEFAKKHGIKELDKIVKKNFKNYQIVLDALK